jgi:hypothetical protein
MLQMQLCDHQQVMTTMLLPPKTSEYTKPTGREIEGGFKDVPTAKTTLRRKRRNPIKKNARG